MKNQSMTVQFEVERARSMLDGWLEAEQAIMTSQEYRMGTKILRRADLKHVAERIRYWTAEIERLEGRSRIKVRQIVSRDV